MKSRVRALAALLALTTAALTGCGAQQDAPVAQEESAVAVQVEQMVEQNLSRTMSATGRIAGSSEIYVIPRVPAKVVDVRVKVGDKVSAGDVLFVLDDRDVKSQVEQANAAYNAAVAGYQAATGGNNENTINQLQLQVTSAQSAYDSACENLARMEELLSMGAVAEVEVQSLRDNVELLRLQLESAKETLRLTQESILAGNEKTAAASVEQARVALQSARRALDDVTVRAPVSGTVAMSQVDVGAMVSQSAVMSIVAMDTVQLTVSVSDREINRLRVGDSVQVSVSALGDTPVSGVITTVAQAADATLLFPVEIAIDNASALLKPGMFATARLILETEENCLSVPLGAVQSKGEEEYVFTVDEKGVAHKVVVLTGLENGQRVQIVEGLSAGDRVVVSGQSYLAEGDQVQVSEEATA